MRQINLSGMEISIVKALGFGGTAVDGETLLSRIESLDADELQDMLRGLVDVGLIDAEPDSFHNVEGMKTANFSVNSSYGRALKDAVNPHKKSDRPKWEPRR